MGWVVNATFRPLYPRRGPGTHCTDLWVVPRTVLHVCENYRLPPGFDPRTVQPVASRYTDCAIPVHDFFKIFQFCFTSTPSLTSILDVVGGQRHFPAALTPKKTRYPCTGVWEGPRTVLHGCENYRPPPRFDPRIIQTVASRYTDCAIPVHDF
jgi:hypothetical protein